MDNKLQELTRKLYDEGLSKGRHEAETLIAEAREQAARIIEEAREEAARIEKEAIKNSEETKRNTATEVALAARQSVSALKHQIENLIVANTIAPQISKANDDAGFIRDMLIALASSWKSGSGETVNLEASLPEDKKEALDAILKKSAARQLAEGLEVTFDSKVKSGFRIGPKDGGYYISFSNEDLNNLISCYLRPQVSQMLFDQK